MKEKEISPSEDIPLVDPNDDSEIKSIKSDHTIVSGKGLAESIPLFFIYFQKSIRKL